MISLTVYILAAFGLSYIVGYAKISLSLRYRLANTNIPGASFLLVLLECPACTGTWIGFFAGTFLPLGFIAQSWENGIYLGLTTCASNLVLARYVGLIGE